MPKLSRVNPHPEGRAGLRTGERLEPDRSPAQPFGRGPSAAALLRVLRRRRAGAPADQRITYGRSPRKRARLMACASSRCFLAETAVIRLGTILPRSETYRCRSFTSL